MSYAEIPIAQAVVAARKTLVEGAVGMVEMALEMLAEDRRAREPPRLRRTRAQ